ncbi:MAG TPA: sodium:solute symporter family protein [Pirellulales bacterium]|jgi:SSS family solute:Na+ symporter|nr:sodium:solute symporter family protein [Pirellulales bacterium]
MSNFTWIDGSIVGLYLLVTMVAGFSVRKYVGKVEHFLVAGREMDVYLGVASLAATEFGIVTCMSASELGYRHGFAGATTGITYAIAMFVVGATGFCVKPLRDAGVVTIAELFEQRFGPRIRWWSGLVIVLGGLLNMGIFLRTGGDFLVLVCGLKPGHLEITMTVLLVGVAAYTIVGGMLSVLVTDFLQFIVMSVGMLAVTFFLLTQISWESLVSVVHERHGVGGFNPFLNQGLGWQNVLFNGLVNLAAVLTWQTTIARLLAAKDTRTGRRVYTATAFFFVCQFLIPALWGIAALATLPSGTVPVDKPAMAMPMLMSAIVPSGLLGLLVAGMLAADMSTDSSYMLTWTSVIYNDLLAPLRKTAWSDRRGIFWNRIIVALIGVFLLFYGLWYPLEGGIWQYLIVTGTIYLSSMATCLVACCYWKDANSWGAAGAILAGATFPLAYLLAEQLEPTKELAKTIGSDYAGIAAFVGAALAMIIGSLLKPMFVTNSQASGEA